MPMIRYPNSMSCTTYSHIAFSMPSAMFRVIEKDKTAMFSVIEKDKICWNVFCWNKKGYPGHTKIFTKKQLARSEELTARLMDL